MKFILYLWLFTFYLYGQDVEVLSYTYHIDTTNTWKVDDAYAHKKEFNLLTTKDESLGFKTKNIWIYVKVKNPNPTLSKNVMVFSYPLHDNITVYKYINGKVSTHYTTGDLNDFDTREIQTYNFAIPYVLKSYESKEFLFKIKSNSSLNMGIKFYTQEKYASQKIKNEIFLGIYYGIVFIIILHNFSLFLIIKDKVYLHYSLFHFVYFLVNLSLNGLNFQYFYPHYPVLNLYVVPIFFILSAYFSIQLAITYLHIEKYLPKITKQLKLMMSAFFVLLFANFFIPYALIAKIMITMTIISSTYIMSISVYIWYKYKTSSAKVFLVGWGFLFMGTFITELQNLGIVSMSIFTYYAAQIGAIIELSLLSLNLAYNYNILLSKAKDKEKQLQTLTQTLEQKVKLRTVEIEEKNTSLKFEIENKNILFKELYHRVKNNLQIVSSLLSIKSMDIKDSHSKEIFEEMIHRIKAISFIHEKLYKSNDLTSVNMQEYIYALVEELQLALQNQEINIRVYCEKIFLNLEISMPIGLIVNELIINSIKHAFKINDKTKNITINMYIEKENTLILEVSDNGKGADISEVKNGFGFQLVESMVNYQLEGSIIVQNNKGMHYKMTFKQGDKK